MKINYNNKRFKVASNSDKEIVQGHILGVVHPGGSINISYHQMITKNELKTGTCFSKPEPMENGKIKIHESWQWTSGDQSKEFTTFEVV